ncbi:FG-GAP-like repeat-containing protein, partial [Neptunomonas sp.]|uniref:FG-GAP-like repeat-containing protein n=1 Tax=Neptunomonas sp. TaxID=1971898 RepID=UPI003562C847
LFETPLGPFDVGGSSRAVTAADLDGDGDNDLALTVPDANTVVFVTNRGGSFVNARGELRKRDLPVYEKPQGILASDIDGDGRMEVVISNQGSDDIWVLHHRNTPVNMMRDCPVPVDAP